MTVLAVAASALALEEEAAGRGPLFVPLAVAMLVMLVVVLVLRVVHLLLSFALACCCAHHFRIGGKVAKFEYDALPSKRVFRSADGHFHWVVIIRQPLEKVILFVFVINCLAQPS